MSAGTLRALVDAGFDVPIVVTRADKRRSRGGGDDPSPVKAAALELGLPVTSKVDDVLDAGVDLGVVVAFGQLIKPHVLDAVPMINVHFSLLPRWRGAAPVERAILAGDARRACASCSSRRASTPVPSSRASGSTIGDRTTADELRGQLGAVGTALARRRPQRGLEAPTPQTGEPTYAAKIESGDLEIDGTRRRLRSIVSCERGGRGRRSAARACWCSTDSRRATWSLRRASWRESRSARATAATGSARCSPRGASALDALAWRNGARVQPGERLGT